MTTLADLRLLAWHTLPCRFCGEPTGRRCVTASGVRTTPHQSRMSDLAIWLSRQPEVDARTGDAAGYARLLDAEKTKTAQMETQLGAAATALADAVEAEAELSQELADTRTDLATEQRARVAEQKLAAQLVADLRAEIARLTPKPAPDRWVSLHYMPPMPVLITNEASGTDYYARNLLNPAGEGGKWATRGGMYRDAPAGMGAPVAGDYKLASAREDVKRGKAAGGDEFLANIMSLSGDNWTRVRYLMQAAAEDGTFRVTPNLDTSKHASIWNQDPAVVAAKVAELYALGSARKVDGAYVLSSYNAETCTVDWWTRLLTALGKLVGPVRFQAVFGNASDANLKAFAPVCWSVGIWGGRHPRTVAAAPNYAAKAHALGCLWTAPVCPQDARHYTSTYAEAENTTTFRLMWQRARVDGADMVQVVTWNDFAETSHVCPSRAHGTVYADLTRFYADWFRTGAQPKITEDRIYLTHRVHPVAAKPTMPGLIPMTATLDGGGTPRDTVEALVFATAPGTLTLNGTAIAVPAGVTAVTLPLTLGTQTATFRAVSVTGPYVVTDNPAVQDMAYHAAAAKVRVP